LNNQEPKERLLELLQLENDEGTIIDASTTWEAFKIFGREYINKSNVALLFQVGVYDFTGKPLFYFDPACQFEIVDENGEYDHFEQLHCELTCDPTDELERINTNLWSFDFKSANDFFTAVEQLSEFKIINKLKNCNISVYHEDV